VVPGARLIILGKQGAGKGTQALRLSRHYVVPHISTGDMFRAAGRSGSELGHEAKRYLDAGELVPDAVTNEMVRERLADPDAQQGFLLDGFPRNLSQAKVLDEILAEQGTELDGILEFVIPQNIVVERMLARGRSDDTEEVIRRRLEVYASDTAPLLDYYRDRLVRVDAVGEVEDVTARALDTLRDGK
jgi:adenylate kinase